MKTLKITSTFIALVPDNFKITRLREEVDGKLKPTLKALKVGKKFAIPDTIFFNWKETENGTLEGEQDNELTEKMWNYLPTTNYDIKFI